MVLEQAKGIEVGQYMGMGHIYLCNDSDSIPKGASLKIDAVALTRCGEVYIPAHYKANFCNQI